MPDWEEQQDSQELGRLGQTMANAVPGAFPVSDRNLSDWYLDFEKDITQFEHFLKGEFYNPTNHSTPWEKLGEAMVNDAGVVIIIGYLRGCAYSKNIIMSNYPSWDCAMMAIRKVCHSMNELLHKHIALGDIGLDINNVNAVNTVIFSIVQASVLRAFQGAENKRIRETVETRNQNTQDQQQNPYTPKSPLDNILGR